MYHTIPTNTCARNCYEELQLAEYGYDDYGNEG
jgi:hypothetical protein